MFCFLELYFNRDNISWVNSIAAFDVHCGCFEMTIHTSGREYCNSEEKYGYKMHGTITLKIPVRNKFKEIEYSVSASHKTSYIKCMESLFKGLQEDFNKLKTLGDIFSKKQILQHFNIYGGKNKFYDKVVFVGKKEHADLLLDYVRKKDGDCGSTK
jgi:hypothetical protein